MNETRACKRIFADALQLAAEKRAGFLEQACAGDSALRLEVEGLLAAHESAGAFLEPEIATTAALQVATIRPGTDIGRYHVLDVVGEGGFGTVYRAQQRAPLKREVALKVVKAGMDSQQVIARFDAERQALALMDHPNVSRVIDAGSTDEGRPYFVMDYTPGEPLTDYCDRCRLSNLERLELFIQVCEGVQHAHQKGIIHRDLKPSNVLVSSKNGGPQVKVIDFGVAKAMDRRLSEDTIVTAQGQFIGTPAYMSPEQAELGAVDIDTRTDIYSLGAMLYELLAGTQPFDSRVLRRSPFAEWQRVIREEDPPKPSTRLSDLGDDTTTIARKHGSDPRSLLRELRGDLDWITLKALEKDRTRRYETVAALAMDVRRYLGNEPVLASPPSTAYRMRKFVRRHRVGVIAGGAAAAAMVLATAGTSWGLVEATAAREDAQDELAKYEQIAGFTTGMLSAIDPNVARDMDVALMRLILEDATAQLDDEPPGSPEVEGMLRSTIGRTYHAIGVYDLAEEHLGRALELYEGHHIESDPRSLETVMELGSVLLSTGRLDEALSYTSRAMEEMRRAVGEDDPRALGATSIHAHALMRAGRLDEADPLQLGALEGLRRELGPDDPRTLDAMYRMIQLHNEQGRLDEAATYARDLLRIYRERLGDDHPATIDTMGLLGVIVNRQGRFEDAEALFIEALERARRVFGERHRHTLTCVNNVGYTLFSQGRLEEAEPYLRQALDDCRELLGVDHPDTLRQLINLVGLLWQQGKLAEAEPYARETVDIARATLGDDHPTTITAINSLGIVIQSQGRNDEAEPFLREAMTRARDKWGDHTITADNIGNMGVLLHAMGRPEEAEVYLREALDMNRRVLGDDHPRTMSSFISMVTLLLNLERFEEAEAVCRESLAVRQAALPEGHWSIFEDMSVLGECLAQQERFEEAEPFLLEGWTGLSEHPDATDEVRAGAKKRLVDLYDAWGRPEEAAKWR